MKYHVKAAKILSSFDFSGVERCRVNCDLIGADGESARCNIWDTSWGDPATQSEEDWTGLIVASVYDVASRPVKRVGGLHIYFKKDGKHYEVQMTDIRNGLFNKLIDADAESKYVLLTEPESRQIKGVSDVVAIQNELSSDRWSFVFDDGIAGFVGDC